MTASETFPHDTLESVRQRLLPGLQDALVRGAIADHRQIIRTVTFKGASVRDHRGETVDWKLPFSDLLAEAALKDADRERQLRQGTLPSSDLTEANLTPFGVTLCETLRGGTLIDLGCGGDRSVVPAQLARALRIPYIGIDNHQGFADRVISEDPLCVHLQGEILQILTAMSRGGTKVENPVLLLSGIELTHERGLFPGSNPSADSEAYAAAVRAEIERLRPRAVVIGAGTSPELYPNEASFRCAGSASVFTTIGEGGSHGITIWVPRDAP